MDNQIPYGRQNINQEDIDSVISVLKSDFLTQGPVVPAFENAIENYCKVKAAIAVNSATSGLHLACLALGVTNGDLVWTTPITFVASSNAALYCGANVDFVDIDPRTYNISVKALADKLENAKLLGKLPKVVIPVHLCGQPCDMEAIYQLSLQFGFKIIEDASHAIGAKYKGEQVGNCRYSDITIFSFHPVKIITTAEGGCATTNKLELAHKMRLLRSHGITREQEEMWKESDGPYYYEQLDLGFNYRMTELQAALGLSQMKRLDHFVEKRQRIAKAYNRLLCALDLVLPWQMPETYSSFHLYVIRIKSTINNRHRRIFEELRSRGILVNLHYIPIYRQPYYQQFGYSQSDFPESERYYAEAISIPVYFGLTNEDIERVALELKNVLKQD